MRTKAPAASTPRAQLAQTPAASSSSSQSQVASSTPADAAAVEAPPSFQQERDVDRMEGARAPQGPTVAEQNAATMQDFYDAFARGDGDAMAALYHPDAVFHDAAFGELKGKEIGAMWKMLAASKPKVVASNIKGDAEGASGHWDADYKFPGTGRDVHNSIDARFEMKDGKILRHQDTFDFQKWALQALPVLDKLGGLGRFIAGSDLVQGTVRHFAGRGLDQFMEDHGI